MSAELEQLNEQRVQMTADIAHDLRTPLTVLGGYLEAMQEKVLDPTPERLETMHNEIQGLIRLVEDLRTLSLADSGALGLKCSLTDPEDLLARAAETFSLQAEEAGIDLRVQTHPSLIQVRVDPERFHQVLSNLVANAIRHTPASGKITLSARIESGAVCFEVRDTGEGIPPESLPHIFDRFYRVSKAREQTSGESGLGLAIARSLVAAHGGRLTAQSEGVGKGSTFKILLQVAGTPGTKA
jgi:signal transduction histidine kinase